MTLTCAARDLPDAAVVVLNVAAWGAWSVVVGWVGHRWPRRTFERERWWSRLRDVERGRRFYAGTLRIHRWKDRLPELGGLFPGGFAKRSVTRAPAHRERFIVETRRAEAVHWIVFWAWPFFGLWNPWWALPLILAYAAAANLPCVAVQRYNRGRLLAAGRRNRAPAARRAAAPGHSPGHSTFVT